MIRLTIAALLSVAACSPIPAPSARPSSNVPSPGVSATAATVEPTPFPTANGSSVLATKCVRQGSAALPGVVEARPEGWSYLGATAVLPGFPNTYGAAYTAPGVTVPPDEGPGRLVLYETIPAGRAYFESRVEESRARGGGPLAVTVCGEATEVWLDGATGELIVGWTDRNKSDVLVANTADFTVQDLVDSAESVYDCCG